MIIPADIHEAALQAVYEAGKYIREEIILFSREKAELKNQSDFVSYVDRNSEALLRQSLPNVYDCEVLGEEEGGPKSSGEYLWVVDPLDGTTNFIHGVPFFAVSVALCYRNRPILGMVYEVVRDEMFSAILDGGAFLNGDIIRVSEQQPLQHALVGTGFPVNRFERLEPYLELLGKFIRHTHGLRRLGSAALDLSYVACGRLDAYYEVALNPWDVAAGALIVQEAGGKVTDFSGHENFIFGGEIVASNALIHNELMQLITPVMTGK